MARGPLYYDDDDDDCTRFALLFVLSSNHFGCFLMAGQAINQIHSYKVCQLWLLMVCLRCVSFSLCVCPF